MAIDNLIWRAGERLIVFVQFAYPIVVSIVVTVVDRKCMKSEFINMLFFKKKLNVYLPTIFILEKNRDGKYCVVYLNIKCRYICLFYYGGFV